MHIVDFNVYKNKRWEKLGITNGQKFLNNYNPDICWLVKWYGNQKFPCFLIVAADNMDFAVDFVAEVGFWVNIFHLDKIIFHNY